MRLALLALVTALTPACLPHIPMSTTEHLSIAWRESYERAADEAARTQRPLLVVLASGDKDGATCPGADFLRQDALRSAPVIELINRSFVPVWINVRTTPYPAFPFLADVLVTAKLGPDRRVIDGWSRTFYVHSLAVSPDGKRLLNPGAKTVAATTRELLFEGTFSYEVIAAGEYLGMLRRALWRLANTAPKA